MYNVAVRERGKWRRVGFDHATVESAREEAFRLWHGYVFLVIPA